jgi:dTDP-4-amino-4,6-dideoxygalactose transaminase
MKTALALSGGPPSLQSPLRVWPVIDETDEAALLSALRSGHWSSWEGGQTRAFESKFAAYLGSHHALAVSSGTGALEVAVRALGIGPGDEVIAPAYCFTAPIAAILAAGAMPVLVDVDPRTFCLSASAVERAITPRTKAILALHLGGTPCDMERLGALAAAGHLVILEDAALALGTVYRGKHAGTIGAVGIFSFQAEKNLASGEGGAIVTDDEGIWQRSVGLHDYWKGMRFPQSAWQERALSYRISDLLSAVLISQLERVEAQSERRSRNGGALDARLRAIPGFTAIEPPEGTTRNTRSLYMIRYDAQGFGGVKRERLIEALKAEGVPAVPGYARPIYENPIFSRDRTGYPQLPVPRERLVPEPCTNAERLCAGGALWLRQQTLLCTDAELTAIGDAFEKAYDHRDELR